MIMRREVLKPERAVSPPLPVSIIWQKAKCQKKESQQLDDGGFFHN